jgi:CRISPR-associated protein Csm1
MSGEHREHSVREYVVAALLHDVGKLIRRAKLCRGEAARRHTEESLSFVELIEGALRAAGLDVDSVKRFVAQHHEGDRGIAPYDRAAARERVQGDDESGRGLAVADRREEDIPLAIHIDEGKVLYVPPCPLPDGVEDARRLAPREGLPTRDEVCGCYVKSYDRLLALAGELNKRRMTYPQLVETLVYMLRSVATFVPAAVYGVAVPDTSLYAHSLLTAALASTGDEFVLVGLDVGKIQDYIKRAGTTRGAMSILRGRSLMINLLQRVAARRLIDQINRRVGGDVATWANVLLDAGGEVVLVLPNVDGLDEVLDDLERRVLEDTDGVLTLYAARTGPYRLGDIEKFRDLWRQREDAVARRKAAYRDYSAKAGGTPNAKSQRAQYSFHSSVCQFCGRPAETVYVKELDLNLCKLCNNEFEAGKAARNLQALVVARGRTDAAQYAGRTRVAGCELSYFAFLDYTVYVMGGTACAAAGVAARLGEAPSVYLVNNPRSFIGGEDNVGYGFMFTNQHLPTTAEGTVKSLEEIETEYAVFLKADANRMGKRKEKASERPSLLATFSTTVSTAYELYPALLASRGHRGDIFVIYAGGDDLALVGDLSALEYAARVAEYAERWGFRTAAGVVIGDPYLPIYYAWAEADRRLEHIAKRNRDRSMVALVTEPVEIALDAGSLGDLYGRAVSLGEIEEEETRRLIRVVYGQLLKAYAHALSLQRQRSPQVLRELAKTFIELAYVLNRRGDQAKTVENLVSRLAGVDISPDGLPRLYAEISAGSDQAAEKLRRAVFGLYLLHLMRKGRG